MKFRSTLQQLVAAAALVFCCAFTAGDAMPSSQHGVEFVRDQKSVAYREVLQHFDTAIRAAPHDAVLAVQRCTFINTYTDEDYDPVESALDDFASCQKWLQQSYTDAPEAQLFLQQQLWGEEGAKAGEALLTRSKTWPRALRGELLAHLSEVHDYENNDERAGELAVEASRLGDISLLDEAIKYLASKKKFTEASRLLAKAPPAETDWGARNRIEAALKLPDGQAALAELHRYQGTAIDIGEALAGRVYLHAGDIAKASQLLKKCSCKQDDAQRARFEVAIAAKNYADAADLIDWSNTKRVTENLQRFVQVLRGSPLMMFKPSMMVGMVATGMIVLVFALLPAFILVPAHYRGLARRVSGHVIAPPLFDRIGLRHAWIGLALMFVMPLIVGALVAPAGIMGTLDGTVAEPAIMFRAMLWGSAAGLASVLLVARPMGLRHLLGDLSTLRSAGWVLLCWAVLFAVGALLGLLHSNSGGAETLQTQTVEALAKGGVSEAGFAVTLLLMAVLVPIAEEVTFRGLLLGGLSRHIGFGWANFIQASLFMTIHNDWPRFPFYLAMGLLGGWLVRRTRALGPAIALHALNNALAVILLTLHS
jgi:hypothetical protein